MATKSDVMEKIVNKANADPAFRAKLKSDPGGAIKGLGFTTRPNLNIKVLEETAGEGYVVLPFRSQPGAGGELSDDALGAVAGGAAAGCAICGSG